MSDSTGCDAKSIALYEKAVTAMKAARRMLFADLGMGFDEKHNLGKYTSLAGDERGVYGVDVRLDREWRVFRRACAEYSTLEASDRPGVGVGSEPRMLTLGTIDSPRIELDGLRAYVVENEDDNGSVDATLVILSADKEVSP